MNLSPIVHTCLDFKYSIDTVLHGRMLLISDNLLSQTLKTNFR